MLNTNGDPSVLGIHQVLVEEPRQSEETKGQNVCYLIQWYTHYEALRLKTFGWIRSTFVIEISSGSYFSSGKR